jgi:hypothetical protein
VSYFEVLSRKLSSGNLLRKLCPSLVDDTGSAQGLEQKFCTVFSQKPGKRSSTDLTLFKPHQISLVFHNVF